MNDDNMTMPSRTMAVAAIGLCIAFAALFGLMSESSKAGKNDATKAELAALQPKIAAGDLAVATFGSGCFWCTESDFDKVKGVVATISGYMGGADKTATYQAVSTGRTRHAEVLQVVFDPSKVKFEKLLHYFWRTTDVVDGSGQFCDRGPQYRPIIFAHTPEQRRLAERDKAALNKSGRFDNPIAVEIADAQKFTPAEDYHQNFYKTTPARYKPYRYGCGRDRRIQQLWGSEAMTH